MTAPFRELKCYADSIELTLPTCLEKSLVCLSKNPVGDISRIYQITFKNTRNEQLYVRNEYDLRDVLKQYCIYKKLCEKIEEEMKSVGVDFEIVNHSVRLKNKTAEPFVSLQNPGDISITKAGGKYCEVFCGQGPTFEFIAAPKKVAPTPPPQPPPPPPPPPPPTPDDDANKKKCCVIL